MPPKPRWPNVDISQPAEMYQELEHVVAFLTQFWRQRTDVPVAREAFLQARTAQITVGLALNEFQGLQGSKINIGRTGTPATTRRMGYRIRDDSRMGLNSAGEPRSTDGKRPVEPVPNGEVVKVFTCPDYILVESPVLYKMYKEAVQARLDKGSVGFVEMGPLFRHQELFSGVVALLKLRWLGRLHLAATSFGGSRCSFLRFLKGVLADCSGSHDFPHLPLSYFDQVTGNLEGAFVQGWPLFVAYVSLHDPEALSRGSSLPGLKGGAQQVTNASSSTAIIDQLVDDIFVSYVAQQSHQQVPVEMLMLELDFFQIRRPRIRTNVESLRSWSRAIPQTRYRYVSLAEREASHVALAMDMPPLWSSWAHSRDEILEMARMIVAHPRTFNKGVRDRVASILTDDHVHIDKTGAVCPSLSKIMTQEQSSMFRSFMASPRDIGRLNPAVLEKCLGASPPRLVGGASRHLDTISFHCRMAREATPGGRTLPPLGEAGTPRLPQLSVK